MKFSSREIILAWLTMVVVIVGITIWFGGPTFGKWKTARSDIKSLAGEIELVKRRLERREEWEAKLLEFRKQLPQHPGNKDVTAELLKIIELTARNHNLNLTDRDPDKEKHVENLYESSIHCKWEGELEPLVRFLYDVQSRGIILDVRSLTATPAKSGTERLKGNFTVDFAYTRENGK